MNSLIGDPNHVLRPALFDIDTDRAGIAETLIDWICTVESSLAMGAYSMFLGDMMDDVEDLGEDWPLTMALAMGEHKGWDADRNRMITSEYVYRWLAFYGREECEARIKCLDPEADAREVRTLAAILEVS